MKKTIALMMALCLMLTALCGAAFADGAYQVQVVDRQGSPLQGVMVQFCSDTECMIGKTDESGIASFDAPAGSYTVHLLKVPAGYEKDSREYAAPETPELMTLTLNQEGQKEQAVAAKGSGAKDNDKEYTIDEPVLGLHFVTPEKLRDLKGRLVWNADFLDDGVLNITVEYYAVSNADWDAYMAFFDKWLDAYMADKDLPKAEDPSWMSGYESALVYDIYAIDGGRGEKELRALLDDYYGIGDEYISGVKEIGSDGDCRFFLVQYSAVQDALEEYRPFMGEFFDEFEGILNDQDIFLSGLTLKAPQWLETVGTGDTVSFTTSDLAGNPVSSAELFARARVTMINCWATWCGPCKGELPELGEMAKEFEAQGCQIVGLCTDATDDEVAAEAAQLLAEAGANYLNLRSTDEIDDFFQLQAIPATFFVDSNGNILTEPIVGADPDAYRAALAEALTLVG